MIRQADFTELSYSFAFTENLMRMHSSFGATYPWFLFPFEETIFGPDMAIPLYHNGWNVCFFQFKRPEWVDSKRAKEYQMCNKKLSHQYFRFKLYRKNNLYKQQMALAKLDKNIKKKKINKIKKCVFYAAPEFIRYSDISRHFFSGKVVENSALFSATDIRKAKKLSNNIQHSVAYEANSSHGYLCSDPAKIKRQSLGKIVGEQSDSLGGEEVDGKERLKKIIECVLIAVQECDPEINNEKFDSMVNDFVNARHQEPSVLSRDYIMPIRLIVLRFLVRNYLNSEMLIL